MKTNTITCFVDNKRKFLYRIVKTEAIDPTQSAIYTRDSLLLINHIPHKDPELGIEGCGCPLNDYEDQIIHSAFVYAELHECPLAHALVVLKQPGLACEVNKMEKFVDDEIKERE